MKVNLVASLAKRRIIIRSCEHSAKDYSFGEKLVEALFNNIKPKKRKKVRTKITPVPIDEVVEVFIGFSHYLYYQLCESR